MDVVVTNPDGQSGRLVGRFVYEDAPAGVPSVHAISPALGVTTGGTSVQIVGTGLHFGTSVTLDGVRIRTFVGPTGDVATSIIMPARTAPWTVTPLAPERYKIQPSGVQSDLAVATGFDTRDSD